MVWSDPCATCTATCVLLACAFSGNDLKRYLYAIEHLSGHLKLECNFVIFQQNVVVEILLEPNKI